MGLMTPEVDGARQELPYLESPEVDGARQPIASVKKYADGAWQEVWSSKPVNDMPILECYSSEHDNGIITVFDYGAIVIERYEDAATSQGSLSGLSYLRFKVIGNFSNPTVKFAWYGGTGYWGDADYKHFKATEAGYVLVQGVGTSNHTDTVYIAPESTDNTTGDYSEGYGEHTTEFSGEFEEIRFVIVIYGNNVTAYEGFQTVCVQELYIDDVQYAFDPSVEDYSAEINDYE